jgi:ABC-type oligopeptide transport system ATPase subunit
MNESTAQKLIDAIDPQINRHTGNIILVIGSSQCGKSTLLANVLLKIFCRSKGFITTFMSPNYDSLPLQKLVIDSLNISDDKKSKMIQEADDYAKGSGGSLNLKLDDLYKSDEWIFTKRGFDPGYCMMIHGMRLLLNKHYGESEKVREFRFCLALDDAIDIKTGLIREVCLTWRNRGISWIQLCQDVTNFDRAVRNSAPVLFFGYLNFPQRREQIVRDFLEGHLPGADIKAKMDSYLKLTENKCFIMINNFTRKAMHLNTTTGEVKELRELTTIEDHARASIEETVSQRLTKEGMARINP